MVVYVWPKPHREIVRNVVLIHSTGIHDHLKKQLISPLNSLANCDIEKASCIIGNRVHIWKVPVILDCPRVKQIRTVKQNRVAQKQLFSKTLLQTAFPIM